MLSTQIVSTKNKQKLLKLENVGFPFDQNWKARGLLRRRTSTTTTATTTFTTTATTTASTETTGTSAATTTTSATTAAASAMTTARTTTESSQGIFSTLFFLKWGGGNEKRKMGEITRWGKMTNSFDVFSWARSSSTWIFLSRLKLVDVGAIGGRRYYKQQMPTLKKVMAWSWTVIKARLH